MRAGNLTCEQLIKRVKELLDGNVTSLANQLGVPKELVTVVVSNIRAVPNVAIGVDLTVSITVAASAGYGISSPVPLPLPDNGTIGVSFSQQLPNVELSTVSC